MRKLHPAGALSALLTVFLAAAFWNAAPAAEAESLEWGGELNGELRLPAGEDFAFPDPGFEHDLLRLDLHVRIQPSERLRFYVEGAVQARGLPEAPGTSDPLGDLASLPELAPLSFELVEAYADVYGLLLPQLDLRLGRQRIVWGAAEKVSVIDNVNPLDLSDPWDLGRRLASDALRLKAYLSVLTVEAVYLPYFRPALLPEDSSALVNEPAGASSVSYTVRTPGDDPRGNTTLGLRLGTSIGGWDLAASYLYGRQSLPVATQVVGSLSGSDLMVEVDLSYPRQHVAGLEAAGELFGIGLWAEAALFWPDYTTVTDMTAVLGGLEEERAEWYAKWTAGLDYTFAKGLYANLQYVHGFYQENSRDSLNDYLLLGLEWKLLHDMLKIGPLGVALEVDDLRDPAGTWGLVLNPELNFYPMDAVQLTAGLRWFAGEPGTTFGGQKDAAELYFKAAFSY
jgi:hypothetical protein